MSLVVVLKTGQVVLVADYLYVFYQVLGILPDVFETQNEQLLELFEHVAVDAIHQIDVLLGKLERCLLELDVAGALAQDKAEVNVHDMAGRVDEQVAVVPVLDLEDVADQTVPSQTIEEVGASEILVLPEYLLVDLSQRPIPVLL